MRQSRAALCLTLILSASGLGADPPRATGDDVVFVAHSDSSEIGVFGLNADGVLTPRQRVTVPGISTPGVSTPLAVSPDRRHLYVATRGEPRLVATFAIAPPDGRLTFQGSAPLPGSMAYLSTDTTGRWLFGASFPDSLLSVSRIDTGGVAGAVHQVLTNLPNAHAIRPARAGARLLATVFGSDRLAVLAFDDAAGTLTPVASASAPLPAGSGPRHLVVHPRHPVVYVLGEKDGRVHVLAESGGGFRVVQSAPAMPQGFSGTPSAADLQMTADGRFLYASDRATNTIAAFAADAATGRLAALGHYATEESPRGTALSPDGRHLLVAGQRSHHVTVYRVLRDGTLQTTGRHAVGRVPNWIEVLRLGPGD